ncbi:ABC transporter substrate-binding protein [Pseudochrobactrum sp. MP213Fo]|uniref:ABC transporter substrate-binding protein n=1 Tax=Pseudochrobactrum sp. MP213Fo TaxID=3022250 RepID=UPI003BA24345
MTLMPFNFERKHKRFFYALAVSTALTGTVFSGSAQAATPADTLVIGMTIDDVISLDPAESFEISASEILANSYGRLLRTDYRDPSKLNADIAESWSVGEDGKTFTFIIKKDQKFASGNPITAHDAAFSLQRAVKLDQSPVFILSQFGLTKDNVDEKIYAKDDHTLIFTSEKAFAPSFVYNCLTATVGSIVDSKLVKEHAKPLTPTADSKADNDFGHDWLKRNYAGSGAYMIKDWRPNEIIMMERNDNYGGEQPPLKRVIYRSVKESASQRIMLDAGDIDIARNLEPGDLEALAKDDRFHTASAPKGTIYYFSLNQQHETLAKPEVREAVKYLVDYDAIQSTLIKGVGTIHQNFLPAGMLGSTEEKPFTQNVEKAKELLEKAGLKDGFTITMDVRNTQPVTGIAESIQQTFAKANIKLEIIPGDGKQTLTKYRARKHDIYIGQWGIDYWDPHTNADTFATNLDNSDNATSKTSAWRNSWEIPELTQKTLAAVMESDTDKRNQQYLDIQKEFRDTSPFTMLYQLTEVAVVSNKVKDFIISPDTNYVLKASKP